MRKPTYRASMELGGPETVIDALAALKTAPETPLWEIPENRTALVEICHRIGNVRMVRAELQACPRHDGPFAPILSFGTAAQAWAAERAFKELLHDARRVEITTTFAAMTPAPRSN